MIYKYNLTETPKVMLSHNARILCVGWQYGNITLWVDIDLDKAQDEYEFKSVMTGSEPPKGWIYVTTLQSAEGTFVQHIYRKFLMSDLVKSFF